MNQDGIKDKRARWLFAISCSLFVVFCALPGLGPRFEHRAPGEYSVTGLISSLAGILAWTLMSSAYQMRGKLPVDGAGPAKK